MEIAKQVDKGVNVHIDISAKLSVMKPIYAHWLVGLYDYLRNKPDLVRKGFEIVKILSQIIKSH